ncbi:hypothetical protein [Alkalihalobacillus pseudalcaliphilus]|uniref:hypothetical protein n=1 Tax=Alkalihalobacillus pseudalcaliphilus TaxID=79884 RepID=UPI00064D9E62|nr:hypothetical protein [Alkalihalobacillus pseudalcaliphilus]KMK75483.1 hypothetical protein AB990_09275 [Alkalihalobacillus pseudalcaliphilus]
MTRFKFIQLSIMSLIIVLAFISSPQGTIAAPTANSYSENVIEIQASKYVTVSRVYAMSEGYPNAIQYNSGGYIGTLLVCDVRVISGLFHAKYCGTVYRP